MTLVFGEYRVVRELARGGMGVLYEVEHASTGTRRALKALSLCADLEGRARFAREAELLARLDHPAIVRIHAAVVAAPTPYLVQDLLAGGTLQERLGRGPLPCAEARQLAAVLARGVEHAHARGVLHRDLKPSNVVFDDQGRPRLVDFGLARRVDRASLTAEGTVLGTPGYLPPEQAQGLPADARSDVYGLGALLYALLVGRPPHEGRHMLAVLAAVIEGRITPPRELRPDVPPDLEAICLRALATAPEARFQTAGDLAAALEAPAKARWGRGASRGAAGLGAAALVGVTVFLSARTLPPATPLAPRQPPPPATAEPALAGNARADPLSGADRAARAGKRALRRLTHPPDTGPVRARFVDAGRVVTLGEKDGRVRLWDLGAAEHLAEGHVAANARGLVVAAGRAFVHAGAGFVSCDVGRLAPVEPLPERDLRVIAPAADGGVLLLIGGERGEPAEVRRRDSVTAPSTRLVLVAADPARAPLMRLAASRSHLVLATGAYEDGLTGYACGLQTFALSDGALLREQILPALLLAATPDPRDPARFALGLTSGDVILTDPRGTDDRRLRSDGATGRDGMRDAAHRGEVRGVAFTPDGRRLVSVAGLANDASADELRWWDVATGAPLGAPLPAAAPFGVQLSPDGRMVAIDSLTSAAEVWAVPP